MKKQISHPPLSKNPWLSFSLEVEQAINDRQPVVALESTVISHGMPYPQNVQTSLELESIIRGQQAIPATLAIMDGKIKVGLTPEELENLSSGSYCEKVGSRDIPQVLLQKKIGATTVSATMVIAQMAGIPIMATGGIGGVHRQVAESWDISSDLTELSQTSVAVICSGVKSILDIGKTLETLETLGVPIIGYGTEDFPAFFTRESGFKVSLSLDSPLEMAQYLSIKWNLGLKTGVVVANPIPQEFSLNKKMMDQIITLALEEMQQKGINGKAVTPFLLGKVKDLTQGQSLKANMALIKHNAFVAAQLAKAYFQLLHWNAFS